MIEGFKYQIGDIVNHRNGRLHGRQLIVVSLADAIDGGFHEPDNTNAYEVLDPISKVTNWYYEYVLLKVGHTDNPGDYIRLLNL